MASTHQIVVVGAGVSGLTSAICLAEAGWPVRVWADTMPKRTTSAVAGAVWAPPRPAERAGATLRWTEHSLEVFRDLARDPDSGVLLAPALAVGELTATEAMSSAAALIPDLRPADPADVPPGFGTGFRATVPMIDMPHYLDYLTRRLAAAGCRSKNTPFDPWPRPPTPLTSSSTALVSPRARSSTTTPCGRSSASTWC